MKPQISRNDEREKMCSAADSAMEENRVSIEFQISSFEIWSQNQLLRDELSALLSENERIQTHTDAYKRIQMHTNAYKSVSSNQLLQKGADPAQSKPWGGPHKSILLFINTKKLHWQNFGWRRSKTGINHNIRVDLLKNYIYR